MVDSRPPVWMLFLALCLACTCVVSVAVGCNFGSWNTPIKVETKDSIFEINGLGGTLKSKDSEGAVVPGAKLSWWLTEIQELAKNDSLDFFCQIGEPENNRARPEYRVQRYLNLSAVDCTVSHIIDEPVSNTAKKSTVQLDLFWPEFPTFTLQLNVSTIDSYWNRTFVNGDYVLGYQYTSHHWPDKIKVAFGLRNWPWSTPENVPEFQTYILIFFNYSTIFERDSTVVWENEFLESTLMAQDDRVTLSQGLDNFAIIDNFTVYRGIEAVGTRAESFVPANQFFMNSTTIRTCLEYVIPHFTELFYDPQFSALLRASEPKSNSKVALIGGVVSAFVVAAIILTVVLLAIYNPTVKKIFRPFSSRKYAEVVVPTGQEAQPTNNWVSGKKGQI